MKKWGHLSIFCLPPELGSLSSPKKLHFLQFFADLSNKPYSVKVIYMYASGSYYYTLSENDMVYWGLSHPR